MDCEWIKRAEETLRDSARLLQQGEQMEDFPLRPGDDATIAISATFVREEPGCKLFLFPCGFCGMIGTSSPANFIRIDSGPRGAFFEGVV